MSDVITMNPDSEAVYDEQIMPLMRIILDVCKRHRIPMIASFQYCDSSHPDGAGFCMSRVPFDGEAESFAAALKALKTDPHFMAFVVTHAQEKPV